MKYTLYADNGEFYDIEEDNMDAFIKHLESNKRDRLEVIRGVKGYAHTFRILDSPLLPLRSDEE